MPEICHRVGIAAPRHRVYEELATKGGVVEFRTPVEGDPELGGKLNLADLADSTKFNVLYAGQFPSETKPVRTTGRADLVADMRVEVTAVAYRAR